MKAKVSYVQMPLAQFLTVCPAAACRLPKTLDRSDSAYFVRFVPGTNFFEVGYLSDRWQIG